MELSESQKALRAACRGEAIVLVREGAVQVRGRLECAQFCAHDDTLHLYLSGCTYTRGGKCDPDGGPTETKRIVRSISSYLHEKKGIGPFVQFRAQADPNQVDLAFILPDPTIEPSKE